MMWEIVSDNEFNPKKITNMIDSTYSKTFDSKVKYEITEVDCCNKGENTIIIKTFAKKSTESITFYFNDKLQIIDILHELPPLYIKLKEGGIVDEMYPPDQLHLV